MRVVRLTTEEGVALPGGAWLGGEKGVLLMQGSAAGNCINILSLPLSCQFPLLRLMTMRGDQPCAGQLSIDELSICMPFVTYLPGRPEAH